MTLVYLAAAWAMGIWLARWAWDAGWIHCTRPTMLAWGGALGALMLLWLSARRLSPQQRATRGKLAVACLLAALLGAARYQLAPFTPCWGPHDVAFYNGSLEQPAWVTLSGVVQQPPEPRDTRLRVRVEADTLLRRGETQAVQGAVLLTVPAAPGVQQGDRLRVYGRLEAPPVFSGFDYREYLARRGVHSMVQQPEVTLLQHNAGARFWRVLYGVRSASQQIIARLLPEPEAALLTGILLGVESGIDPALYDQFNRTGTSHIIVISGFNISIIARIMTALLGRVVGQKRAFAPVVMGIVLYVLLVGADAAVLRAGLMGILVVWAAYLQRQSTAAVSLFVAGAAMTALNPLTLWDVGFQLSFMATLSLILFATPMTTRFEAAATPRLPAAAARWLIPFVNDALIVTLAATILTLPLMAYYFGRISLVSPLTNLLVLPVQPSVMIWGGAAVLTGLVADHLPVVGGVMWQGARAVALIPWLCLHWTVAVVQLLARLPFAATALHSGVIGLWGSFALIAALALSGKPRLPLLGNRLHRLRGVLGSSRLAGLLTSGLLVGSLLLALVWRSQPDGLLHVWFLGDGQTRGEAVLIVTPDGQQVLVDGGYSPTALHSALGRHIPFYDRDLELVVLTHSADERSGGLVGLTGRYRVQRVMQAPFPYPSANYESWLRELRAAAVPVTAAEAGTRLLLGHGIALDVLAPPAEPVLGRDGELNPAPNSVVLRLSWGETSFLLLGDTPAAMQDQWAASGLIAPATVVKLAQAGRAEGLSTALLAAAQPTHAVVFVQADDRFRTLAGPVETTWLMQVGEDGWHRTDLAGAVELVSDGHTVWLGR